MIRIFILSILVMSFVSAVSAACLDNVYDGVKQRCEGEMVWAVPTSGGDAICVDKDKIGNGWSAVGQ